MTFEDKIIQSTVEKLLKGIDYLIIKLALSFMICMVLKLKKLSSYIIL